MSWKASENRTFYLFLALPLLYEILPKAYAVHLYAFVYGKALQFDEKTKAFHNNYFLTLSY